MREHKSLSSEVYFAIDHDTESNDSHPHQNSSSKTIPH